MCSSQTFCPASPPPPPAQQVVHMNTMHMCTCRGSMCTHSSTHLESRRRRRGRSTACPHHAAGKCGVLHSSVGRRPGAYEAGALFGCRDQPGVVDTSAPAARRVLGSAAPRTRLPHGAAEVCKDPAEGDVLLGGRPRNRTAYYSLRAMYYSLRTAYNSPLATTYVLGALVCAMRTSGVRHAVCSARRSTRAGEGHLHATHGLLSTTCCCELVLCAWYLLQTTYHYLLSTKHYLLLTAY